MLQSRQTGVNTQSIIVQAEPPAAASAGDQLAQLEFALGVMIAARAEVASAVSDVPVDRLRCACCEIEAA